MLKLEFKYLDDLDGNVFTKTFETDQELYKFIREHEIKVVYVSEIL